MNRIITVAIAIFCFSPISGVSQSPDVTPASPREARNLIKSAHTITEYKQLAAYFHLREAYYRTKAADEKIELDRRAQVNAPLYQKYPRPVDTAKALYDSYVESADGAAQQATHFDQLAAGRIS